MIQQSVSKGDKSLRHLKGKTDGARASDTNSVSDLVSYFAVVMSSMLRKQAVKNLRVL